MSLFPRKRVKKSKFKLRVNINKPARETEEKTKIYKTGKVKKRVSSTYDPSTKKTVKRRVKFKNDPSGTVKKDIYKQNGKRIKAHKMKD